jgi:aryl-alcohol dehydrogenase-like predicted oxidoreductase
LVTATVVDKDQLAADDFRRTLPRFDEEHWNNNQQLIKEFAALAAGKGISPAQLALAWVLAQGEDIIPIPGTKKIKYLEENAGAVDVKLSATDLKAINDLVDRFPDIGTRYNEGSWKLVDK